MEAFSQERETVPLEVDTITYAPGEWIFRQGDLPTAAYVIQEGVVNLVRYSPRENEAIVLDKLSRGDLFGDQELFDGNRRLFGALAATAVTAQVIIAPSFLPILQRNRASLHLRYRQFVDAACAGDPQILRQLAGPALSGIRREKMRAAQHRKNRRKAHIEILLAPLFGDTPKLGATKRLVQKLTQMSQTLAGESIRGLNTPLRFRILPLHSFSGGFSVEDPIGSLQEAAVEARDVLHRFDGDVVVWAHPTTLVASGRLWRCCDRFEDPHRRPAYLGSGSGMLSRDVLDETEQKALLAFILGCLNPKGDRAASLRRAGLQTLIFGLADALTKPPFEEPAGAFWRLSLEVINGWLTVLERDEPKFHDTLATLESLDAVLLKAVPPTGGSQKPPYGLERAEAHWQQANMLVHRMKDNKNTLFAAMAEKHYRLALSFFTEEVAPLDHAYLQERLGYLYKLWQKQELALHNRAAHISLLEQAHEAYRKAFVRLSMTTNPFLWAQAKWNHAEILYILAKMNYNVAFATEALAATRAAMLIWRRRTHHQQWAILSNLLGSIFLIIAKMTRQRSFLKPAQEAFIAARDVCRKHFMTKYLDVVDKNISQLQDQLKFLGQAQRGERKKAARRLETDVQAPLDKNRAQILKNLQEAGAQILDLEEYDDLSVQEIVVPVKPALFKEGRPSALQPSLYEETMAPNPEDLTVAADTAAPTPPPRAEEVLDQWLESQGINPAAPFSHEVALETSPALPDILKTMTAIRHINRPRPEEDKDPEADVGRETDTEA